MNRNANDSSADDPVQPDITGQHKDRLPESGEKDITRRERSVIAHEAAVLSREKAVTEREVATGLREKAANSRQDAADVRGNSADLRQDKADVRENTADMRQDTADVRENSADMRQDKADVRENAADLRQDTADVRENAADMRQDTADVRENAADMRQGTADVRENAADMRQDTANVRETSADLRQDTADVRETAADLRQDTADLRETAADLRQDTADLRETAADLRQDTADLRETAADLRQDTADLRRNAVHLREGKAAERESQIREAETNQAASDKHMTMLQQVNANLVIATIEAHKMAEKIQIGKDQLAHMAHYDMLTDLPNRILLLDRLNRAIELAHRQGWQLALMFMDLDQFKHINDSLGHTIGDHLLQSVAKRLLGCARQSDTISRQGGDEFVKLLPFIASAEDATLCAQKILAALDPPHHIDGHDLHISMSIGISIYPNDGQDAETLIKCADTAMYYAKDSGRNNYKFFEQDMNARAVQRHSIEASLRRALERQEFVLYYQPKVDLHSGAITGVEALIRWRHPERGLLLPALFIPIAEDCGLILPIGRWVLRTACIQAQAWRQAGLPPVTVAVNTSALEFRAKGFFETIRAILDDTGLEPCYLELELTESVLMQDAEATHALLHELSDLGVKLAIDDFGTGYSSLSYLRQFPIDTMKIDQSFVNRMTCSPDDASIVRAVISMSKSLNQRVIAEGVETPEQYAFLQAQDCDEGQGYYFGRPVVAEALATLLQTGISLPLPA